MSNHDHEEKLEKLLKNERVVMFTTQDAQGRLKSRPMTIQEREDWVFRFIAQDDNDLVEEAEGKQVNLALVDGGTYVSLSGTCAVEHDLEKKRELWNRINEAYADDPEDPKNVVLEVTADSAEYWDGGSTLTQALKVAKAVITKEKPKGDHGTVDL